MSVFKPRNRVVTFRLAEDEFEHLKNLCVSEGARSISDLARATLCNGHVVTRISQDAGLDARVRRLDGKVEELDRAVKELVRLVGNAYRKRTVDTTDA